MLYDILILGERLKDLRCITSLDSFQDPQLSLFIIYIVYTTQIPSM